tara:strand:- start:103 stop:339 length:237 start_codon:yes stop_codon:yes gene_type:complete
MANKKDMEMMAMNMFRKQQEESIIGTIMDEMATENIQLKNTIQQMQLKTSKENLINQGRTKPVNLTERRSGKRKGGTI